MTTLELDEALLDELGEVQSQIYSSAIRYRFLSRAYHDICRTTYLTLRPMATFTIAVDDESFDLNDKLSIETGYGIFDVVKVLYLVAGISEIEIRPVPFSLIKMYRNQNTDSWFWPKIRSFYRDWVSSARKPYLDIYPKARHAGSDILFLDWLEKSPDLTASQNPITPAIADNAIWMLAAARMLKSYPDDRYGFYKVEAEKIITEIRGQSYKEASGRITTRIAR